jgi:DNA-binding IclR family transcriptional regulator
MVTTDDATAQHVRRTLHALELLAEGPQSQADLARRLAVHRRTVRRLIARLVEEGYAEGVPRGRHVVYVATPRLAVLGRRVAEQLDVVALGRRRLASIDGDGVTGRFVALVDGDGVRLAYTEGVAEQLPSVGPLHATAAGKVFLSADTALLETVLNRELLAFTSATLTTRADLLLALATVRAQGFAMERGEHRGDVHAVASGVRDHAGRVVAALGVTVRADRDARQLGSSLREAAAAFSREIGGGERSRD